MNTTSLYAIKTDCGYGLFQHFQKSVICGMGPFYIIYNDQISSFDKIADALSGDYYYLRLRDDLLPIVIDMDNSSSEKQVTYSLSGMTYYCADYRNCHVAYLGEYELPSNAIIPRYSRFANINYITGKHSWSTVDEYASHGNLTGKLYKTITPEIEDYPYFYLQTLPCLLKFFNLKLTIKDFNDAYVDALIEDHYLENPNLRPSKEAYDDIKRPLPTEGWRSMLENPDAESEYLEFCDKIEGSLDEFLESIDNNRRSAKAPLVILMKALNKIAEDTGLICTLEREGLYEYLVRVLRSLKKPTLINTIDELRDW
jgi:hypothetical protein